MPLPRTKVDVHFVDKDSNIVKQTVSKKETGYEATPEYYPTMRVVKCSGCGQVGVCEFLGGMNLKEGDRLMDGKPIRGTCHKCGKRVDLVPLPTDDPQFKKAIVYYQMQRTLDAKVARGEKLTSDIIVPIDRVLDRERQANEQRGT
mgnify:CR=1 FL=1